MSAGIKPDDTSLKVNWLKAIIKWLPMMQVKGDPGLAGLSDKDLVKRVMPFAQFRMKEAQRAGKQVRTFPLNYALCAPISHHYIAITPILL